MCLSPPPSDREKHLLKNRNQALAGGADPTSQSPPKRVSSPVVPPTPSDIDALMDFRDPPESSRTSEMRNRKSVWKKMTSGISDASAAEGARTPLIPGLSSMPRNSVMLDAGQGLSVISTWVSDAVQQTGLLDMKVLLFLCSCHSPGSESPSALSHVTVCGVCRPQDPLLLETEVVVEEPQEEPLGEEVGGGVPVPTTRSQVSTLIRYVLVTSVVV